jgi:hypothetical protein
MTNASSVQVVVFQLCSFHWIYSFVRSEVTPKKLLACRLRGCLDQAALDNEACDSLDTSPLFKFVKTKGRFARILSVSASITARFASTRRAKSILLIIRRSERAMPGPPLRGIFSPSATSIT